MKSIIKNFVTDSEKPIEDAIKFMEYRAKDILKKNDWYKDLYIDPNVDIVNSHPQVIQQVKEEISDFLNLLKKHDVKNLLQICLVHWASTHYVLSLLLENITTIEYDVTHVERYMPESSFGFESIITGDSLQVHKKLEDESFDVVFIILELSHFLSI